MFVTPIYAAILGLVFVVLSIRTILVRRKLQVAIGDGEIIAKHEAIINLIDANFLQIK